MTGQDDDAQDKATPEFEAAAAKPKRSRAKRTKDQPPVPVADVSEPVDGDNLVSQPGPQDPAPSDPAPDTRLPDAWAEEIYPQDLMALDTVAPEWATQDNAAPTDDVTDWTDDTPGAGRYDTLGGLDAADPMDDAALQYEFNPEATESDDTAFTPDLGDANDPGIRTDPPYDPDFAPYGSAEVEQNDPSSGDAAYTLASSDETQATQAYDDATEPAADGIEPAAQVPPAPASGGRSIIALLLGGVLAAGVGFVAARYVQPQGWPFPGSTEQLNAFDQRLSVQEQTIADLRAAPAQTDDRIDTALADLADLATVNGALTEKLDALGNRLAELEARPQPDAAPDTSATELLTTEIETLKAEVAALRTELASRPESDIAAQIATLTAAAAAERQALETRAAALQEETRAATTAATARGVLLRVQAVIDTGGPISSLLDELAATGVTVPAALRDVPAGVPTVSQLQDSFPEAARTAAAASIKVSPDATLGDRTLTFLRRHTGARSLTPRDGADPDAVLSRAEAALRGGDVAGALAQLDQLPADAQAAMSEWRASAQTRVAASVALGELTAGLSGN